MAFNLGTIETKVKVDGLAEFGSDLKKADATMDAFAQQSSRRFTRVETDIKAVAKSVGMSAQDMEAQISRAMKSISADTATKSLERMARQMGLSKQETAALGQQMGLSAGTINNLTSKLYGLNASVKSTETAMGGLKTAAIAVGAAFATYKVADFVKESAMLAARYETLGVVMETVGANAGYTAKEMNSTADALQKTGITMVESRQQATKLVQAHMDLSKATDLARVAQNAAVIAGENSSATFARLVDAIQTAQPEMLRTVGINVNFETSYKKLAAQLHTTVDALDENEKMQARWNAVMERSPDIADVYEKSLGTAGKAILSLDRYLQSFQVSFGTAFGPALKQYADEATVAMKAFQDEISRPEAQHGLSSLASGAAQLGTNLMRGAVPALNAAVTAINDLVSAWGKIPAPLQGLILGGGVAGIATKFNPMAMLAGAAGGAAYVAESTKDLDQKIKEAQKVYDDLNSQKGGIGGFITSAINGDQYLDDLIKKQKKKLDDLVGKRESLRSQAEIRMPVSLVGPDGKPLEQTIKKKIEEVTYSATDSDNLMKGTGTAQYQLGEAWSKNLGVITQLQRKIDSGKLSQEDMTRAINDQAEAWGRIKAAQESYDKKANAGQNGANAAARYAERTSAYLEQAQDQYDQLVAQLGGDSLGAKIAAIEKKYDKAESAIRQAMIGAKGSTEELNKTLEITAQSKALEILAAQADAWKKSMQDAANMLAEIGRLTGDPQALYGATMATAQAWEADQAKRISAIEDEAEREKQLSELRQAMALKEVEARRYAYEGVAAVSSKYWDAEKERIQAHLDVVKQNADDEYAYRVYAAQQWDEYNRRFLEQQAATAGTFAETLSSKWSLAFGGYKSETTKAKESWDRMSDSIIQTTDGMIDGIAGGFGDMIRSIGNGCFDIEDLWRNMLARMLDAFASFVESLVKQQLQNVVSGLFSGSTSSGGTTSLFGGSSSSSSGGIGSLTGGLTETKRIGEAMGTGFLDSFSGGTSEASSFIKSLSKANTDGISDVFKNGNISGWNFADGSSVAGDAVSSAMGLTSSASSVLGTVGSALGMIGAIGGVVGIVSSLFGDKKEEIRKVASGYNVGYNAGHSTAYGVDFYSDGSVQYSGPSNPDVQKKISDAFRNTAEALSDFAEELGFAVDVLEGFSMPNMNITDDQLDGYIRNGENMMAFKGLMEAGMRGAFDYVARDGEVYVDEYERLSTSLSTVRGGLEAYGYELSDVAMITQEQLDAIRAKNTEVAEGTAQAMQTMAASMGATDDVLAQIARDTPDATAALAATEEQLSSILEADYASDLLDAVGGEDAFAAMMGNLTKNVFDTIGAYAENLTYYNDKATSAIGKLNEAGVTVDNFWIKFDEAIKKGLTVDEFEAWGKASTWVNQIDTVTQAMEDWNDAMKKTSQSLDQRMAAAQGFDYQAKLAKQMADAEWELAAAREAGYDAAVLTRLKEVQAAELAATIRQHQEDYNAELLDATKRYATALDDQPALIAIQMQENEKELQDLAKEFNWSVGSAEEGMFQALQKAQWAELINQMTEWAEAIADATAALTSDIAARRASLNGLDAEAEAIQKLSSYQDELSEAYKNGVSQDLIDQLSQLQLDEMADYWAEVINDLNKELGNVGNTLEDRLTDILDRFTDYTNGQLSSAQTALSVAEKASSAYKSASESIEDTIKSLKKNNAVADPRQTYKDSLADWQELYAKALTGDIDSLTNASTAANDLMSAASEYFANSGMYEDTYASVIAQLAELDTISTSLGIAGDYQVSLLEAQVEILTQINNELSQANPDEAALNNMVAGLGVVSDLLAGTRNVYITDDATAPATRTAINELTGQTVQIGGLSLDQLKILRDYSQANVDATGEVVATTEDSNAYLATQQGLLASGNATQDILRQFSAQNISVSQEIKNAILGDSAVANSYLANVQTATTQMATLLSEFLKVSQEQMAANELLVKQAQVAAAQSQAQTIYNQTIAALQGTNVGSWVQKYATTGVGWTGISGLSNTASAYGGRTYYDLLSSGTISEADFFGWYYQNYGTGTGQVDWSSAMSLLQSMGILPSNVSSLLLQYNTAYQQYLNLKAQYGFAVGGVVPGSSFTGDTVLAGLNSGERVLTAEQNRSFERLVYDGGADGLAAEVKALREENKKISERMERYFFALTTSTANISKRVDDFWRRGIQTIPTEA